MYKDDLAAAQARADNAEKMLEQLKNKNRGKKRRHRIGVVRHVGAKALLPMLFLLGLGGLSYLGICCNDCMNADFGCYLDICEQRCKQHSEGKAIWEGYEVMLLWGPFGCGCSCLAKDARNDKRLNLYPVDVEHLSGQSNHRECRKRLLR